jgi:hypothetical protein
VGGRDMKTCRKCKTDKEEAEFYKEARRKEGIATICKKCQLEEKRVFWLTYRDLIIKRRKYLRLKKMQQNSVI